jgi:hypothetical protein
MSAAPEEAHVPAVICAWVSRSGGPCTYNVVQGARFCQRHGGALEQSQVRQSHLFSAYAGIVEAAGTAVDALVDVSTFSSNDLARVQAANSLLDRAGLGLESQLLERLARMGEQEQRRIDSVDRLVEKLATVADRLEFQAPSAPAPRSPAIIDVEPLE